MTAISPSWRAGIRLKSFRRCLANGNLELINISDWPSRERIAGADVVCYSFQAGKSRSSPIRSWSGAPAAATTQADVRPYFRLDVALFSWRTALRHIGFASLPYSLPNQVRRLRLATPSDNVKLYAGPVQHHRTCPNTGATDKDAISADIGQTHEGGAIFRATCALHVNFFKN
jgi:hypothetical protein